MFGHVGNPWISSQGMNSGATPTRVYGLQAPEIQMQGEEIVRRGEGRPALGPSVLASCGPPLAA